MCGISFKLNGSQDILNFVDFMVPETALHNETINKTRKKNDQENFAHSFGDNYLANYNVKFLQDRIKL